MSLLQNIFALFYPKLCLTCETHLLQNEQVLCASCRNQLPETDFINTPNNLIENALKGRVPFVAATSLLFYRKKGIVQSLIHSLKYKNKQEVGVFFGKWMGEQLKKSKRFEGVDVIIIVPLHPSRYKQRGYNQLSVFANVLSDYLKIPVRDNVLVKVNLSNSQTKKDRLSRFEKMNERFKIANTTILKGKHVLLVDDVFTTGATIEACANEILKTPDIKISIATMVVSDKY